MICNTCVNLEIFDQKGKDEFFNKCVLLDIWNLEEGEECEYFTAEPDRGTFKTGTEKEKQRRDEKQLRPCRMYHHPAGANFKESWRAFRYDLRVKYFPVLIFVKKYFEKRQN